MSNELTRRIAEIATASRRNRLSKEQEDALVARIRQGDVAAKRQLMEANLSWVVAEAFKLARQYGLFDRVEEFISEGTIGLDRAIRHYDPERGCRLSTYALYWIRVCMRMPFRVRRTAPPVVWSLDAAIGDEDDTLHDRVSDEEAVSPAELAIDACDRAQLHKVLERLRPDLGKRGWAVLHERILNPEATLAEVGAKHNVSRENIRQIEVRVWKILRAKLPELLPEMLAESEG